ncbi:hypothetical protein JOQ06_009894 [Pogonophryne albipinna]|uniref:Uncharacterized protein n=1 Tax=Pogonophryne albipinna TaxID=1090488 RepID=A0AAD6FU14_9TELE|nr:hypothetical protein JOQ06_009894 [Pogonophryne albipinna]
MRRKHDTDVLGPQLLWLAARPPAFPHLFPIRPLRSPHKQSLSPWPPASHQAFVSKHGDCSPGSKTWGYCT